MDVLTLGTFDLPHYGHFNLIERCKQFGVVWVGLNSDEFVEKYKGKPPVMTYNERRITLEQWGCQVCKNDQPDGTIKDVISYTNPDLIVIGTDWLRKPYLEQIGLTVDDLEANNISLMYVPYTKGISTTEIKARMQ